MSSELVTLLQQGAKGYTWAAAAVTANGAAPLQIAAEVPVMAIGGFNGTDPAPSLAEFQQLVAQGKVHYFVGSSGGGFGGRPQWDLERDLHLGQPRTSRPKPSAPPPSTTSPGVIDGKGWCERCGVG